MLGELADVSLEDGVLGRHEELDVGADEDQACQVRRVDVRVGESDSCFPDAFFFPFAMCRCAGNTIERPTGPRSPESALNLPEITDLRSPTDPTEVESKCQTLESKCHGPYLGGCEENVLLMSNE